MMTENLPGNPVADARRRWLDRHPLGRLVIELAGVLLAVTATQVAFGRLVPRDWSAGAIGRTAGAAAAVAAAVAAYAWLVRVIERRRISELSTRGAGAELAGGVGVGGFLFTAVIGTLWSLGYYHVTGVGAWSAAAGALAGSVVSGAVEEILFRGVIFRNLEDLVGTWAALVASAALFGLLHISNPHSSPWAAAAIAIEAGVLLAAGFVLTRRLWLVMGIHFAWNFTQGGIFGVAVSGGHGSGLITSTLTGPPLISGGEFGAEASVFAVAICLAVGVVFTVRAHALGHFLRPAWRRTPPAAPDGPPPLQ
jgi:uncharacterized protein